MTHPHTTSLEVSKKLADACTKMQVEMPEPIFYWCNFGKDDWRGPYIVDSFDQEGNERWLRYPDGGQHTFRKNFDCFDTASAYQLGELMRMLPERTKIYRLEFGSWVGDCKDFSSQEDEPENAAAELLTELILSGKVKTLSV